MLFISPPFGNYIKLPNSVSITGSFTLEPREGLLKQIIKTLRYSKEHGGWVNKIGLRNKGIDWALKNIDKEEIISIAILKPEDIEKLCQKIPENRSIEINVSCPNVDKQLINKGLGSFINPNRKWCILKLSPNICEDQIDHYYKQGFRQFHCSNTIPVKEGGLSGKALMPFTKEKINIIKTKYKDSQVIAGGGVRSLYDANMYKREGADHISVSSLFFNPFNSCFFYLNYMFFKRN